MKTLILAALAASAALTPMIATGAEAQVRHTTTTVRQRPNGTVVQRTVTRDRTDFRRWNKGQRFDRRYARNYSEIRDWRAYRGRRLYAPPRGYHWVRSGNDAVLVAVTGGLIGAVLAGAFN